MNKTKPKKFTFKNRPRLAGLAAVGGGTPSIDIKYAGIKVGYICFNNSWGSRGGGITIHLMLPKEPTEEKPCPWRWGYVKHKFVSADEAKKYLNDNFEKISKMIYVGKQQ